MIRQLALFLVAALTLPCASGCPATCRDIDVEPLDWACDDNAQFSGEIHLDSAAVFETFLRDQCTPTASDETIADRVDAVDFDANGVFVTVGNRLDETTGRCLEERGAELVQVCEAGLRVSFGDEVSERAPCPGRYTVAFSLARDDLRAALAEE